MGFCPKSWCLPLGQRKGESEAGEGEPFPTTLMDGAQADRFGASSELPGLPTCLGPGVLSLSDDTLK